MSETLVSVLVTCYNHEKYIEQCLRSIFNQTHNNIELIVLNDGSTDNSGQVIKETLKDSPYNKTHYFVHDNSGVVRTRNKGLQLINGDFFLFVDSDDYLEENYVSELLYSLENNDADIAYCNLVNPENGAVVVQAREFDLNTFLVGNYISSTSLVRTSVLGDVKYDDSIKQLEDYDFFLNLVLVRNAKPIANHSTFLNYRVFDVSRSARGDLLKFYEAYIYILTKYQTIASDEIERAIGIHFDKNINLAFENQYVKIYYIAEGENFSEDKVLKYKFEENGCVVFNLPEAVTTVRVDLSELPSFYKRVALISQESDTEILSSYSNGDIIGNYVMFKGYDPQLIYDVSISSQKTFKLIYEMFNVDDINRDDYIAKTLSQDLLHLQKQVKELESYRIKYKQVDDERQYYKQELERMIVAYNSVTHSRRWTIPTAIINFFRRKK
ncbi:glycosyltransferase family 2 protein [Streptococcus equinus]|uniref:glycosyltransferase family 2 protein n=1 Tax=Streptococcus equinus TaxID=1335 RepID=UPI0008C79DB2|nr:glycosyltransferase family 2 protein [Streptococcus equinus]SEI53108.1 glucosyltransferase [Streptococcus equinus]SFQ62832.1 glucosyltransferase [Streptococcus equinus]